MTAMAGTAAGAAQALMDLAARLGPLVDESTLKTAKAEQQAAAAAAQARAKRRQERAARKAAHTAAKRTTDDVDGDDAHSSGSEAYHESADSESYDRCSDSDDSHESLEEEDEAPPPLRRSTSDFLRLPVIAQGAAQECARLHTLFSSDVSDATYVSASVLEVCLS